MDQFMANYFSYRVVNEIYESKISSAYRYPVFIFVEEAHNFVPPGSVSQISQIIKKIASEGRKFGIFLVVITQRPGKIDQDVLSQCNSEIILRITNPLDQKAVIESGESVGESVMTDLPSLDVGEGILLGEFVRMPVIVRIKERETSEGGGDVDIVTLLKESLNERKKNSSADGVRNDISSIMGD
jgi:DNA helicase HerA-like ATPase